uniref:MLX-interacting protein n=1 Tax=Schistocephalus solidus TaxID=70667 RepID=A0A0X3Q3L1_SCHSO
MCAASHTLLDRHNEIQSGQFMISNLEDSESESDDFDGQLLEDTDHLASERASGMPEFDNLQSLFKCLSVAYVENLTSPRWSHFKGAKFALKNKIRLNNIIWREYHMQYVKQLRPIIVQFQVPLCDPLHNKAEGIVMEGKFWKRHTKTLCNEYRRWRTFFCDLKLRKDRKAGNALTNDYEATTVDFQNASEFTPKPAFLDDYDLSCDILRSPSLIDPNLLDELMMDFEGSLDVFFDQPFPNPRDMPMLRNSDIMQPGLVQLQPNPENSETDLIATLLQQPVPASNIDGSPSLDTSFQLPCNTDVGISPQLALSHSTSNQSHPQTTTQVFTQSPQLPQRLKAYGNSPSSPYSFQQSNQAMGVVTTKNLRERHSVGKKVQFGDASVNRVSLIQSSSSDQCICMNLLGSDQTYPFSSLKRQLTSAVPSLPLSKLTEQVTEKTEVLPSKSEQASSTLLHSSPTLLNALLQSQPKLSSDGAFHRVRRESCDVLSLASTPQQLTMPPPTATEAPTKSVTGIRDSVAPSISSSASHSSALIVDLSQNKIQPTDRQAVPFLDRSLTVSGQSNFQSTNCVAHQQPQQSTLAAPCSCHLYYPGVRQMPQQGQQPQQQQQPPPPPQQEMALPSVPQRVEASNTAYAPTNRPLQTGVSGSPVTASIPYVHGGNFESGGRPFSGPFEQLSTAQASPSFGPNLPPNSPLSTASATCFQDFSQVTRPRDRLKRLPFAYSQQPKTSMVQPGFPESNRLSAPFSSSFPSSSSPSSSPPSAVVTTASISSFANDVSRISLQGFAAMQTNSHSSSSSSVRLENREHFAPPSNAQHPYPHQQNHLPHPTPDGSLLPKCNISSAPDLYAVAEQPLKKVLSKSPFFEASKHHTSLPFTSTDYARPRRTSDFPLPGSNETKPDSPFDASSQGGDLESPNFEDDVKPFSLICRAGPSGNTNQDSESMAAETTAEEDFDEETTGDSSTKTTDSHLSPTYQLSVTSANTEQRRRLSMQSSLKTLQQLIEQYSNTGPNKAAGYPSGGRTTIGTGSRRISQSSCSRYSPGSSRKGGASAAGAESLKTSKASILRGAAGLIQAQRAERSKLDAEISRLHSEIEVLQSSINACCEKLPVSGAAPKRQASARQNSESSAWYRQFVSSTSQTNWKFYVFSLIIDNLFDSYCDKVSTASREVLRRSVYSWLDQHCSLPQLRHSVVRAMCKLSTSTNILQQPNLLPQQAREAAARLAFPSPSCSRAASDPATRTLP